ncbi:DUF2303 family protein [Actinomadura harenae]|uniref:DUF2303 family protein n=1 Tax=Actinomadura harenae TaxID=2483351 RepID=A0A3M2MCZ0_9ACTN|nr:DUF2303 family protein [Actinomadura harenae]RMI47584.1 DUF2303 family protein [Actinomadura harenae]
MNALEQTRTENDALVETAILAAEPIRMEGGEIYGYRLNGRVEVVDLTADRYLDEPKYKRGTVTAADVASFALYYAKHADASSEVYADLDRGTVTAVLDAHLADVPRWEQHMLVLALTPTEAWKRWTTMDRRYLGQVDFAEFLEDNLSDLASEPVPAAEMLEIARTFQARTRVNFSSGVNAVSGDINLRYEETTDTSGGTKGQLTVPRAFAVGLAPFDDCAPYRLEARLRHRIKDGRLTLAYLLDRPEDVVRDAVKTVMTKVEETTGIKVMRGRPAAL